MAECSFSNYVVKSHFQIFSDIEEKKFEEFRRLFEEKKLLKIQTTIECRSTLKRVRDIMIKYTQYLFGYLHLVILVYSFFVFLFMLIGMLDVESNI